MQAKIVVDMDNGAFEDAPGSELVRVLRNLADRIESEGPDYVGLFDSNGNKVGTFTIIN